VGKLEVSKQKSRNLRNKGRSRRSVNGKRWKTQPEMRERERENGMRRTSQFIPGLVLNSRRVKEKSGSAVSYSDKKSNSSDGGSVFLSFHRHLPSTPKPYEGGFLLLNFSLEACSSLFINDHDDRE
jgi:hypothetical protein